MQSVAFIIAGGAEAPYEELLDMGRSTAVKRKATPPDVPAGGDAEWTNYRASEQAARASGARKLSVRRRMVDPTTCDREYSKAEMEFMKAISDYKHKSGRMFPTWSEVLEVLRELGYEKIDQV